MNNPLAVLAPPSHETAATAAASQVKALVEARYTVAMHRPRDMDQVRERLLKECKRPSFAEVARYNKPIGKGVVGPSIRFAEAAIRCMGNVVIDETTTYDDDEKRIIQVSVTDLEANVPYSTSVTVEKTVERSSAKKDDEVLRQRTNSKGYPVYILRATEDDILNKKNALLSKAIRTLALRLVPGDLTDECMDQVVATQKAKDAADPDAARKKLLDAFTALNVSVPDLKAYLGVDLDKISPAELIELRALHAAIRDGETTWRAAMESRHPTEQKAGRMADDFGGTKKVDEKTTTETRAPSPREVLNALLVDAGREGVPSMALTAALAKAAGTKTISQMTDAEASAAIDNVKMEIRVRVEGGAK